MKGVFITFEGGEGCGKSTQCKLLEDYLKYEGYKVFSSREPGGDFLGEKIRDMVKSPEYAGQIDELSELFLFLASRAQYVKKIIIPKLNEGYIVISDRFSDSTMAYQGYGRGLNVGLIGHANGLISKGTKPDLTFLIDISAERGLSKMRKAEYGKADRIEAETLEFHKRVNEGFREIAKKEPSRIKLIPYIENGINEMQSAIREHVKKVLKTPELAE